MTQNQIPPCLDKDVKLILTEESSREMSRRIQSRLPVVLPVGIPVIPSSGKVELTISIMYGYHVLNSR